MSSHRRPMPFAAAPTPWRMAVLEAAVVALLASVVALAVNSVRSDGLSLIARTPYQTLVPCPEPGGPAQALAADDLDHAGRRTFLIDARRPGEFASAHLPGAVNVPYDWLDPIPEHTMKALARDIAASRAVRVIVYGDGGRPDSGEYLGREISGRGIKNVFFIQGGAPVVLATGGGP